MTDNFLPDTKKQRHILTVIFRILAGPAKHFLNVKSFV